MHENFIALQQEKRDRILNVVMQEFSSKGFKNASTNEIVKKAGISKGALFHYFSSKRDLFEFVYKYSLDMMKDAMEEGMAQLPRDIFERWIQFALLKMKIKARYTQVFDFSVVMARDDDAGVQKFLEGLREQLSFDYMKRIHHDIDTSRFKPEMSIQKATQILSWVVEGYIANKLKKNESEAGMVDEAFFREAVQELEEYFDVLRKTFYRED